MVLANGTEVDLGALGQARVVSLLGQGGQGYVFEVQRASGEPLALKWYRPESATTTQFHEILQLVEFGSPHERFLWPLSMARSGGHEGFGYVMNLRDQRYLELSYLLSNLDRDGNTLDVSFASTIELCRQLSFSFLRLHARGLCYRDISFGNVFFDPGNGDVLICDNDNVGVDDGTGRVLGTPYFMAPEVVSDLTYNTLPSTDTDRHSLAVLLFYSLFLGHPLEGAYTDAGLRDAQWLTRHFGTDAIFCMHPDDARNRPAAIVEQYWSIYPRFIRDLFTQAFVEGLSRPSARVTEGQWIKAFDRLRDGMVSCARCGTTNFWDPTEHARPCRSCSTPITPPYVMQIGRRTLAVSPLLTLRNDHLTSGIDDPTVLGQVRQHPQEPARWGLRNVSPAAWMVTYLDGTGVRLEPNRTVELAEGARIQVGASTVVVRRPNASGGLP
ncbi:protein kinase domain-containing protein [Nocardioides sp. GXZ039]|uniref:protein kinase domain-containing protein n=1 Tax=Nocardioides sp. GXZ039 TaxID=3136018 RepID=UPI0030F377DF